MKFVLLMGDNNYRPISQTAYALPGSTRKVRPSELDESELRNYRIFKLIDEKPVPVLFMNHVKDGVDINKKTMTITQLYKEEPMKIQDSRTLLKKRLSLIIDRLHDAPVTVTISPKKDQTLTVVVDGNFFTRLARAIKTAGGKHEKFLHVGKDGIFVYKTRNDLKKIDTLLHDVIADLENRTSYLQHTLNRDIFTRSDNDLLTAIYDEIVDIEQTYLGESQ